MSRRLTYVLTVLVTAVAATVIATMAGRPLELLATPNRTTIHVVERSLVLAETARTLPAWVRWIAGVQSVEDSREWARGAYDEALAANLDYVDDASPADVERRLRAVDRPRAVNRELRARIVYFFVSVALVLAAGMAVLAGWWLRGRRWPVLGSGHPVAPWGVAVGYGVAVRSVAFAVAIFLLVALVPEFYLWGYPLASLGMIWMIHRHLLVPRELTFKTAFGLGPVSVRRLVPTVLAAFAVGTVGEYAIMWLADATGSYSHWAEFIPEELVLGPTHEVVLVLIDAVVWAPLFEEIGFRGLVYATLRTRLGVWPALVVSATLFSVVHLYSWQGFLAITWSGLIWAYLYERTRSLWAPMACHAVGNVWATCFPLLLYR